MNIEFGKKSVVVKELKLYRSVKIFNSCYQVENIPFNESRIYKLIITS